MTSVGKYHKEHTGDGTDDWWKNLQQLLFFVDESRVQAPHRVRIQHSDHSKHREGEECVDKVPSPELVFGNVIGLRAGVPKCEKTIDGGYAVVNPPIDAGVTIGEARNAAHDPTDGEEDSG